MPHVIDLLHKLWPDNIPPVDYRKAATLVSEFSEIRREDPPAPRPAAPPPPPVKKVVGRPRRKPVKAIAAPASRLASASKPALAREALAQRAMTGPELAEHLGGHSNIYMLLHAIGAIKAGARDGTQLYVLPGTPPEQTSTETAWDTNGTAAPLP